MTLPTPIEVSISSTFDGTPLSCRIYLRPLNSGNNASLYEHAAVIAHPYASLGGDYNDPVVLLAAEELCNVGYVVLTFNFRGANHDRKAATSWTSKAEQADYKSVAYFLIQFMLACSPLASTNFSFILAGYSYGSMMASMTPPAPQLCAELTSNQQVASVKKAAQDLAIKVSGNESGSPTLDTQTRLESHSSTSYLLISPILPPVTSILTLFSGGTNDQYLESHRTLALFGSEDHFTSCSKLRQWSSKLGIQSEEIEGAGHFWQELNAVRILRHTISEWAR